MCFNKKTVFILLLWLYFWLSGGGRAIRCKYSLVRKQDYYIECSCKSNPQNTVLNRAYAYSRQNFPIYSETGTGRFIYVHKLLISIWRHFNVYLCEQTLFEMNVTRLKCTTSSVSHNFYVIIVSRLRLRHNQHLDESVTNTASNDSAGAILALLQFLKILASDATNHLRGDHCTAIDQHFRVTKNIAGCSPRWTLLYSSMVQLFICNHSPIYW